MNTKPIVCIDVDGVLRDLFSVMSDVYFNEFGIRHTAEEHCDYRVSKIFTELASDIGDEGVRQWFFRDHSKELFYAAKPCCQGIGKLIDELREYAQVFIITYQQYDNNKTDTIKWLSKNKIHYDNLIFTEDKSIIKANWFIDDFVKNIENCNSQYKCMINAPYNKDYIEDGLFRYDSIKDCLTEIINYLKKNGK